MFNKIKTLFLIYQSDFKVGDWVEITKWNGEKMIGWVETMDTLIENKVRGICVKHHTLGALYGHEYVTYEGRGFYDSRVGITKLKTELTIAEIERFRRLGYPPPSKWKKSDLI